MSDPPPSINARSSAVVVKHVLVPGLAAAVLVRALVELMASRTSEDAGARALSCARGEGGIPAELSGEELQGAMQRKVDRLEAMRAATGGANQRRQVRLRKTDRDRDNE